MEKAVAALLNARRQREILHARIKALQDDILLGRGGEEAAVDLDRYSAQLQALMPKITSYEAALGKASPADLATLRHRKYMDRRIEARVSKTRLRARVIQRKMEFTRVERPFRTQASG